METILNFLGGGLSGGLFGILGGLGTAWLKYSDDKAERQFRLAELKSKQKHEVEMIKAETDAAVREVEANIRKTKIATEGQIELAETAGRNQAIERLSKNTIESSFLEKMLFKSHGWKSYFAIPIGLLIITLQGFVDILRTLVRPVITYGSVGFSMYVTYYAFTMYQQMGLQLSSEDLYHIIQDMIKLLTFTTSTVIGFWFMDKSMSRKFQNS